MGKTIITILICMLLFGSCFAVEPIIFTKASINKNEINVTFANSGIRYLIELNDKRIGINEYGQNLTFKKTDKLRLSEKHAFYLVTYIAINDKCYLQIKETKIDEKSGEEIKRAYYRTLEKE